MPGTIERVGPVANGKQTGGSVTKIDTDRKIRHGNPVLTAMQLDFTAICRPEGRKPTRHVPFEG